MQYQVSDKGAHQVPAVSGIQQGHVNDADVDADLLGQNPPLGQNFLIIAPQAVDAQYIEQVPGPQPPDQLSVLGPAEILSRILWPSGRGETSPSGRPWSAPV